MICPEHLTPGGLALVIGVRRCAGSGQVPERDHGEWLPAEYIRCVALGVLAARTKQGRTAPEVVHLTFWV